MNVRKFEVWRSPRFGTFGSLGVLNFGISNMWKFGSLGFPMLWGPQAYNAVADHAANVTMDCGRSWNQESRIEVSPCNWHLAVDGGLRKWLRLVWCCAK